MVIEDGLINLAGAIVRQAILDAHPAHVEMRRRFPYASEKIRRRWVEVAQQRVDEAKEWVRETLSEHPTHLKIAEDAWEDSWEEVVKKFDPDGVSKPKHHNDQYNCKSPKWLKGWSRRAKGKNDREI